ncbi:glycine--tRNA ligase [Candidatus Dependentiae bacterium]|nr:MAG: glycine--tRNA ligase [Candidatus Dependentiae bacterium]
MALTHEQKVTLDKLVSLCKRRGFVYQSAEIYGGINGVYDFGHLGTLLKRNLRSTWLSSLSEVPGEIILFEGALLGPYALWKASGHVDHFADQMVECRDCKHRFRIDEIDLEKACPHCGKKNWSEVRQFNMMFQTQIGAVQDQKSIAYLRPETAQEIFVNFKNVITTNRLKLPFGIAQIGKAFRNEITPKQFLFRMREFEQMELEWFCKEENAKKHFEFWKDNRFNFYLSIGIKKENLRLRYHEPTELAHYSTCCTDVEYHFPFGWKELEGIAHRGNYDLSQHIKHSGKDLSIYDEETKKSIVPTVIECSVGVDRLFLTVLFDAYDEDTIEGESRVVLKLSPKLAPIKAAFFPLTKKQNEPMYKIYEAIKNKGFIVQFDESGSIGKRYRRNDEIGTPYCFTYDFESDSDKKVTARDRDTTKQERIAIDQIELFLEKKLI